MSVSVHCWNVIVIINKVGVNDIVVGVIAVVWTSHVTSSVHSSVVILFITIVVIVSKVLLLLLLLLLRRRRRRGRNGR